MKTDKEIAEIAEKIFEADSDAYSGMEDMYWVGYEDGKKDKGNE